MRPETPLAQLLGYDSLDMIRSTSGWAFSVDIYDMFEIFCAWYFLRWNYLYCSWTRTRGKYILSTYTLFELLRRISKINWTNVRFVLNLIGILYFHFNYWVIIKHLVYPGSPLSKHESGSLRRHMGNREINICSLRFYIILKVIMFCGSLMDLPHNLGKLNILNC